MVGEKRKEHRQLSPFKLFGPQTGGLPTTTEVVGCHQETQQSSNQAETNRSGFPATRGTLPLTPFANIVHILVLNYYLKIKNNNMKTIFY